MFQSHVASGFPELPFQEHHYRQEQLNSHTSQLVVNRHVWQVFRDWAIKRGFLPVTIKAPGETREGIKEAKPLNTLRAGGWVKIPEGFHPFSTIIQGADRVGK